MSRKPVSAQRGYMDAVKRHFPEGISKKVSLGAKTPFRGSDTAFSKQRHLLGNDF